MNSTPFPVSLVRAPFTQRNAVVLAAMAAVALTASLAQAQTGKPGTEGAVKLAEGVLLYPTVKLSAGRDDNVRAVNTGAISATVTVLAPALRVEAKNRSGIYNLSYNGAYGQTGGRQLPPMVAK